MRTREIDNKEILEVLPILKPNEFIHKGVASKIGVWVETLRKYYPDLSIVHECFKGKGSYQRWMLYHRKDVECILRRSSTMDEATSNLRKIGVKCSNTSVMEVIKKWNLRSNYCRNGSLIEPDIKVSLKEISYLIGYFIGDGHYRGREVSWYTTTPEVFERFRGRDCFRIREYRDGYFWEMKCLDTRLKDKLINNGIPERKTYNVDYTYQGLEKLSKADFLAGWIDADGWIMKNSRYCIANSSRLVLEQLVEALGKDAHFTASKKVGSSSGNKIDLYNISLSKRLSVVVSKYSEYMRKRLDYEEFEDKQSKIRKKDWDTRDCLRFVCTDDGMFLCKWCINS